MLKESYPSILKFEIHKVFNGEEAVNLYDNIIE